MALDRNKLYLLLSAACLAGYVWLYAAFPASEPSSGGCLIKHATGVPCPSCGSTRSVMALLQGNFLESLYWNPLGLLLFVIMVATPFWISYDLFTRKNSLQKFYHRTEHLLHQKAIAVPAVLILMGNWFWNICKGL